jgi:uncharacterized protein (TIGR02145 family)
MGLIFKIFTPKTTQKEFFMKHSPKTLLILLIGSALILTSCGGPSLIKKCGTAEYDIRNSFCLKEAVYSRCGEGWPYDPASQVCSDGAVLQKCGSDTYNPSTHFCKSGTALTAYSTFTDSRDGKTYRYVTIGAQTWMADNLNYAAEDSKCYLDVPANCDRLGRLYTWSAAKKACPSGWHLPNDAEWNALIATVGDTSTAGKHLKARPLSWEFIQDPSSWELSFPDNLDSYGFSAIPSGLYYEEISNGERKKAFSGYGNRGTSSWWWSATGTVMDIPSAGGIFNLGNYWYMLAYKQERENLGFTRVRVHDDGISMEAMKYSLGDNPQIVNARSYSVRCVADAPQAQPQQEQAQEPQPEPHKEQHQEE